MESTSEKLTIGLALSGSGNRSSYYIGFLEVLDEQNLKPDYIAACSGSSLVAAAYACGTLNNFKEKIFTFDKNSLKNYLVRKTGNGGLFNIDLLEEEMKNFTRGLKFEDVRPLMGFVAVDIENGEKVLLCMGDIAKAARISCTLPGAFEPVKWGGKTLVDGGLLTMVPGDFVKKANMDITIGVNMRGTKHIFTEPQITAKRVFNFFTKMFFLKELESLIGSFFKLEDVDIEKNPNFFQVVGRSLDIAIKANKSPEDSGEKCDITITPPVPRLKQKDFCPDTIKYYYEMGRQGAFESIPKIRELIKQRSKKI